MELGPRNILFILLPAKLQKHLFLQAVWNHVSRLQNPNRVIPYLKRKNAFQNLALSNVTFKNIIAN